MPQVKQRPPVFTVAPAGPEYPDGAYAIRADARVIYVFSDLASAATAAGILTAKYSVVTCE